ncbi:MAG: chromosome segregation protein SMC, partial [Pseudomonadota bacterium]
SQYRTLQEQGTLKLHQLWFLKHRDAANEEARVQAAASEAATALEARLAELRHTEAELEHVRQAHYAANDTLHARQGELAQAALEVSRLEERIRYVVEGRQRAQARLADLQAQNTQWAARQEEATAELDEIAGRIAAAEEQADTLHAQAEEQGFALPDAEEAVRSAQQTANTQRAKAAEVQQQIQLLAADSRNVEEQSRGLKTRRERLAAEQKGLSAPDMARIELLRGQEGAANELRDETEARLADLSEQVPALDEQRRSAQEGAAREAARLTDIGARLSALRALQDKVQTQGRLPPWLERHGLAGLQGLWKQVHVEPGWEPALEAALRERLHALAVGRLDTVRAFAADAPPARLAFYALPGEPARAPQPRAPRQLPLLVDLVRVPDAGLGALLGDWLEGVFRADSLEAALAARGTLAHGEVIMTREGHAVSQFAVCFYAPDSEQAGLLARAQEIENLERQQRAQQLIADESRAAAVRLDAAYGDAAQRLAAARREAAEAQNRAHALHVEVLRLAQQAEATSARHERIAEELAELDAGLEQLAEREATGQARFEELDLELASAQEQHAALDDAVLEAERALSAAREQQRALERQAQEASFQARALASRRAELQRGIETAAAQVASNLQAGGQLELELGAFDDAAVQSGLQGALALRVEREQELASARSSYDGLSARLKALDEQRLAHERSLDPMRERITRLQLEEQAAALGGAQFLEQLVAAGVDLAALEHGIAEGKVRLQGLQGEIDRIQQEIAELGAVNLAALEELGAARERKAFLDAQNADLQEAIRTLEDAIHRIDLETRELLASTFNQVNEHFGRMFPVLFGGGTARLAMTGAEILDAGVQVMAQPPGKRNSTIHLLSGGEKALTAIALVFAIFQLNPAPFCLLDEVDAPLDDANTERYARLVAQMSRETQFLFISHNKITMEMAEQLIGVTMQEQGVSRIVAVDIEAAVSLAEAA